MGADARSYWLLEWQCVNCCQWEYLNCTLRPQNKEKMKGINDSRRKNRNSICIFRLKRARGTYSWVKNIKGGEKLFEFFSLWTYITVSFPQKIKSVESAVCSLQKYMYESPAVSTETPVLQQLLNLLTSGVLPQCC